MTRPRLGLSGFRAMFSGRSRRRQSPPREVLKGRMQNIIVVEPPDPMFREAIFILKDEYLLKNDVSRTELLRQAREAAQSYTELVVPPRRRFNFKSFLLFVLTALIIIALSLGVNYLMN